MRVVQTTFGVFHSFDLARELHRRGLLERIFSTWPWARLKREALSKSKVGSFPWLHLPEYALERYGVLPPWLKDQFGYANALLFDEYTLGRIPPCDAIIGLSGSSLQTGMLVQKRGGVFVCDRGSSHPKTQERLLKEEFARWGIDRRPEDERDIRREISIYWEADHVVVPSTFALQSFVENHVPAERISVIPYGMKLDLFRPLGQPPRGSFEVVFVGSVSLRKGIPYLLQAFAKLTGNARRLRIVGHVASEMRSLLARLPVENVEFLGIVPQRRLGHILSTSHLLVMPSIEDGFGMVLGQAMACGCPVMASMASGGPDLVSHGDNGFLVPPRDVAAMALNMQLLMDDPSLRARMAASALSKAQTLGGWHSYGDAWEALLRRLVTSC